MCSCWALTSQTWIGSNQDWFHPVLWSCQGAALCSVSNHSGSLLWFKMPQDTWKAAQKCFRSAAQWSHGGFLGCSGRSFHFLTSLWAALNWGNFSPAVLRFLSSHIAQNVPEDGKEFLTRPQEIPWGHPQPRQTGLGSLRKFKFTPPGQHGEALHPYFTCQCPSLMLPLSKQQQKSILLVLLCSSGMGLFSGCIFSFFLWWILNFILVRN